MSAKLLVSLRKLFKYIKNAVLGIGVSLILAIVLLNLTPVQNFLSNIIEKYLSEKLGTTVSIDHIDIGFPDKLILEGIWVEGQHNDTILYADAIKGKISNLISFTDKIVINYVGVEGGYFNLIKDSTQTWNYQYIIDAFKQQDQNKEQKELVLNLEDVLLKDTRLNLIDQYHGSDLYVSFKEFDIQDNYVNSTEKSIDLGKIFIDELDLQVRKYMPAYPLGTFKRTISNTPFNPHSWTINLDNIKLKNSKFKNDNDLYPFLQGQFDGSHIDIKNINIDVDDVYVVNDSIFGHVKQLTAIDKSGIEVQQMTGNVKVSPRISEIKNFYLKTNKSTFRHYFAMEYPRFPAFLNFINEVTLVADFRNSTVAIEDIGYFAPKMNRWQTEVYKGEIKGRGTIDKLDVHHFDLTDNITTMKGAFSIHGIPDMPNTIMTLDKGEVKTTYTELLDLFPEIKNLNLPQFEKTGNIAYTGDMKGVFNDLTFNGLLKTDVGDVTAKNLNLNYSDPQFFRYKGHISSQNVALNTIIDNNEFGIVGYTGEIEGDGFNYKNNTIKLKGTVYPFHFKNYAYDEMDVDVSVHKGALKSNLVSKDPNALLDMDVAINFNDQNPQFVYKTNMDWLDLNVLNLTQDTIMFRGVSEGTFTGSSLKNMEGQGVFKDFMAIRDLDTFFFSELAVHSIRNENDNYVNLKSDDLNMRLSGKFYLDEIGKTFQNIVSYYLPEVVKPDMSHVPDQNFQFLIESSNLDKFTKLIYPDVYFPKGLKISGTIKDNTNDVEVNAKIPYFQYKNVKATNVSLNSYGDLLGMKINLHANDISAADKKMISELDIVSTLSKNNLDFNIATTVSNDVDRATINGHAYTNNDSIIFKLNPSELFFNNQRWVINGGNEIIHAKNYLHIDNFKMQSNEQTIVINSDENRTIKGVNNISLSNINLQPILQMVGMVDLPVYGDVDGLLSLRDLPKGLDAEFDLETSPLTSVEHTLGVVKFKGTFESDDNTLTLQSPTGMYDDNGSITLLGTWSKVGSKDHVLNVQTVSDNANLTWAEPFMSELTKGLEGQVNGFLNFEGLFNTPKITGQATIVDGSFIPLITGVRYHLPETKIDISSHIFTIHNSILKDDEGNSGYLTGTIAHDYFSDLNFQLRMNSPKLKVLDLKENEAENFYGKVYGSASLVLTGLLKDMNMNITAKTLSGSKLYIPLTDDIDLNEYNFITFKEKYNAEIASSLPVKKTKINITMDALVTPDLDAVIIMDPITNEIINSKGTGNLSLFIPSDGDMRLNGTYTIQSGYYDFILSQLQLFVYKNRFNILDGSVINWDGAITEAKVNVKGNTIKRTRLYDLITDDIERMGGTILQSEKNDALLPQNVIIDMNMTGALLSPDFKFDLKLEETRSIGTYAYQKLQRINSDDRELLNQVVSLLVVNQFMPTSGMNSNIAVNTGVSNVTEMVSTFASSQLTNFTNKLLGVEDLYVNLKYKNYNISDDISTGGLNYINRNEAGLSVRKNFFSDRIVLDVGGVYDWGRAGLGSNGFSDNFAVDFRLNYLLTPDGRLRLNIFRNSNFDAVSFQNVGKQGVGINYRKSFDDIYDLLGMKYRPKIKPLDIKIDEDELIPLDTLELTPTQPLP